MEAELSYMDAAVEVLRRIQATQMPVIRQAADIFADSIARDGLVHMFGTGHSRMFLEEMYPGEGRSVPDPWYGTEPGYHEVYKLIDETCESIIGKYIGMNR